MLSEQANGHSLLLFYNLKHVASILHWRPSPQRWAGLDVEGAGKVVQPPPLGLFAVASRDSVATHRLPSFQASLTISGAVSSIFSETSGQTGSPGRHLRLPLLARTYLRRQKRGGGCIACFRFSIRVYLPVSSLVMNECLI